MQETGNNTQQTQLYSLDLIAQSFNPENSMSYNISIRELSDGFCLCVYSTDTKQCVAIKTIQTNEIKTEPLLSLHFNHTYILHQSIFAVVPNSLSADKESLRNFLIADNAIKNKASIDTNSIDNKTTLCFDNRHFPSISPSQINYHPISTLIIKALNSTHPNTYIAEQDGTNLNIAVIKNKKLQLANTFNYSSTEDAAYYILAVYQQLNLDVCDHTLTLYGNHTHITNTKQFLHDYINTVTIISDQQNTWDAFTPELFPQFALQII